MNQTEPKMPVKSSNALRASALMAAGSTFSRILGFVRTFLMGMVLGGSASIAANAYSAANVLPNSIWTLIGGGTLNAILVPAIVRAMKRPDAGSDYMSRLFTLVLTFSATLTVISMLFVPVLITVANSRLDPGTAQAATVLAYFLMPQILFSAVYIMVGQILNAHESFGPFQWAPALNNVVAIIGAILFLFLWGTQADGTKWSWQMITMLALIHVGGAAAQAILVFAWSRKIGIKIKLKWGFRGLGLGKLSTLGLWTLAMLALGQLAVFAGRWSTTTAVSIVEQIQNGSANHLIRDNYPGLASLDWSYTVFIIPQGIIAVALVTSIFSRMSTEARDEDHLAAYETYARMNRILLAPMALFTVLLVVLASPIMWVAIGGTSRLAAEANGLVLIGYALGLVPFAALYLVRRYFYAYEDARTSFIVQIPITAISLLAVWPILEFVDPKYAAATAAAVLSFGNLLAWLLSLLILNSAAIKRGINVVKVNKGQVSTFIRICLASLVSGVIGFALFNLVEEWIWISRIHALGVSTLVGAAISLVFFLCCILLRVNEVLIAINMVLSRVKRSKA